MAVYIREEEEGGMFTKKNYAMMEQDIKVLIAEILLWLSPVLHNLFYNMINADIELYASISLLRIRNPFVLERNKCISLLIWMTKRNLLWSLKLKNIIIEFLAF